MIRLFFSESEDEEETDDDDLDLIQENTGIKIKKVPKLFLSWTNKLCNISVWFVKMFILLFTEIVIIIYFTIL